MQRFVRLLAGYGCAPRAIEAETIAACRRISRTDSPDRRHGGDAGHVLTLWFSDPNYLGPRGRPRPLPLRGSTLSIEALARRIDPELDPGYVARFLEEGGAVTRIGRRYIPRQRHVIFRDRGHMTETIRGLFGLLRTLEHNQWCDARTPRQVQLFARNPRFPVSAVAPFLKRLRQLLNPLLVRVDADMHRRERTRKPGERTVRMGVGVYQFEEEAPSEPRPRPRKPRRKR